MPNLESSYYKYLECRHRYKYVLLNSFGNNIRFNGKQIYSNATQSIFSINSLKEQINRFYRFRIFTCSDAGKKFLFSLQYNSMELCEKSRSVAQQIDCIEDAFIFLRAFDPLAYLREHYAFYHLPEPDQEYLIKLQHYWDVFMLQNEEFLRNYVGSSHV